MNKLIQKFSFIILSFTLLIPQVYAGDKVVVIVNKSNVQKLSVQDVKNIYNDKVGAWEKGNKIAIYNLPVDAATKEVFAQTMLGLSASAATTAVSRRKVNNTLKNLPEVKSERLVAALVSKNPNAIGYVSEKYIKGKKGIRVVLRIGR